MNNTVMYWFTTDYLSAIDKGTAPDYGTPIAVIADVTNYGTAIVIEFPDGKKLSPYFNQNDSEGDCYGDNGGKCGAPDDCEFGWCGSDRFNATEDADAWLDGMAGATNWDEWEWLDA
jgi:hypothetical protein